MISRGAFQSQSFCDSVNVDCLFITFASALYFNISMQKREPKVFRDYRKKNLQRLDFFFILHNG